MWEKVYIIILNWNGWKDTIECLESVLKSDYKNYQVIICDNHSQDDSVNKIKLWAEGKLNPFKSKVESIDSTSVEKPIQYREYSWNDIKDISSIKQDECSLILLKIEENKGFSGGNNVGINFALKQKDTKYIWLLNNDTVIKRDTLTQLIGYFKSRKNIGICGSKLMQYYNPDSVQSLGGRYNKWIGTNSNIKKIREMKKMDYVIGASMLVSKELINDIGMLSEDYFLYFEELDWALRAKMKYTIDCACSSIVYHKEGASIGSNSNGKLRSELSDYYLIRNRLLITKKFFKYCMLTVYCGLFITFLKRIWRGQYRRAKMVLEIILKDGN